MRKTDSPTNIDELMLNVLGGDFFKIRGINARLVPVLPKKIAPVIDKILEHI